MSVNGINMALNVHQNDECYIDQNSDIMSLEERMLNIISTAAVNDEAAKTDVFRKLNNQNLLSSPEQLFEIQNKISDQNIKISLTSILTKKAVDAVTTLISH
ncbi:type III secretion system inner rod subunit SctI [Escherichia coli]